MVQEIQRQNTLRLICIFYFLLILFSGLQGQEYWQPTEGPYGGPIECMVYNSKDEAFAFTLWGGLFFSGDHGGSWAKRNNISAHQVVVDSNDVLIVSEYYISSSSSINRSADGGLTWTRYANVINASRVLSLAINSNGMLFAGTLNNGMFRSEDGGAIWTEINTNLTYKQVNAITTIGNNIFIGTTGGKVFHSRDNGDTWASKGSGISDTDVFSILHDSSGVIIAGTGSRIYRSTDYGTSWTEVASGLSYVNNFIQTVENKIYAATSNGIYRSDDGGLTWISVNNGLRNTYVMTMAVSSTNVLLAGTYIGFDNGIYRSTDYGSHWTVVNDGLRGVRIWKMATASSGIIYAAAFNSGMFRSIDGGYNWEAINNGLTVYNNQISNIRALTVSPDGKIYIGAYGAGVFRSDDNGDSWIQIINGLPSASTSIMGLGCGNSPGLIYAGAASNGVYKSTNYGASWIPTGTEIKTLTAYDLLVGMDENVVFAGVASEINDNLNGLYRSINAGGNWQKVGSGDITTADVHRVVSDSKGTIFVATSDFGIFRSMDGGTSWDKINQGLLSNFILTLAVNRLDHIFAGGGGVYVSKNNGDNWNYIPAGMPDILTNSLSMDPTGNIFNGTTNGVYRSIRPTTQLSVQFTVKMRYVTDFNPSTDQVVVRGNFNGWGEPEENVYLDPVGDGDKTWVGWFTTNRPDTILTSWFSGWFNYWFYILKPDAVQENLSNVRIAYWEGKEDLELPVAWFGEVPNDPQDASALQSVYNNTNGSSWTDHTNWLTDQPFSHWYGVTAADGQVTGINLAYNNANGTLPASIGNLSKLRALGIFGGNLSGSIPSEINSLDSLVYLNLSDNSLTGLIPALTNKPNLTFIDLSSNQLSSSIPATIGYHKNITNLLLYNNKLTGNIPVSLWTLTNLQQLLLNGNQLEGTLPAAIGNLPKIEFLLLSENKLTGTIPVEIGNLTTLISLVLANNSLSGTIPQQIGNLTNLNYLLLNNNSLTGNLPATLSNLVKSVQLDFSSNQLTGSIPDAVFQFPYLQFADFSNNTFTGSLSPAFVHAPVTYLSLAFNALTGALPPAITNYDSLQFLNINNNQFSGLPALTSLKKLTQLYVINNLLTFEDLEPNISIANFLYSPQDSVGTAKDTTVNVGSSIILSVQVGGANNQYRWYKDDALITGATGSTYTINPVSAQSRGVYSCRINNTVVTGLMLYSRPIKIIVPGSAPVAPTLTTPTNGQTNVALTPTLSWNAVSQVDSYQVQLSLDNIFTPPLLVDQNGLSGTSYQVSINLSNNTTYYWRVRGINDFGAGDWSAVWNFTTLPGSGPSVPVLVSPANGVINVVLNPTLIWNAAANADAYDLQVAEDNGFTNLHDNLTGISGTSKQVLNLKSNTKYFWHVRATNSFDTSGWSTVWDFTTETVTVKPNAPVLAAPSNGAGDIKLNPALNWNAVSGVYRLQIARESGFTNFILDVDTLTKLSYTYSGQDLEFNTTYFWRVNVTSGLTSDWSTSWSFTTEDYPSQVTVSTTRTFPSYSNKSDYKSTDYRLFGVPGEDNSVTQGDLVGGTPNETWTMYWDNGKNADYMLKYDGGSEFRCFGGRAFWFLSMGSVNINRSILSVPLNSNNQAEISLHSGWNIITSPFPFAIDWNVVKTVNGINKPIIAFLGATGLWQDKEVLEPYAGYYFDNSGNLSKIMIPYTAEIPIAIPKPLSAEALIIWQVKIKMASEGIEDHFTRFGISSSASKNMDDLDYRKPRAMENLPGAYFYHPDWDDTYNIFATDIRPQFDESESWIFTVNSCPRQVVRLSFEDPDQIPPENAVYLIDRMYSKFIDLRSQYIYDFVSVSGETEFEILVGKGTMIQERLSTVLPDQFELGRNFPNPFNPVTTIPVVLPEQARATLKIFDLLGKEIKIIFEGTLTAGKHYFLWDGNNHIGLKMPSGIYLYHLTVENGIQFTGKMILVK